MAWFLQSLASHDTHWGTQGRGSVYTVCGIRFRPLTLAFGRTSLPGEPADPLQVCPRCRARGGQRHG